MPYFREDTVFIKIRDADGTIYEDFADVRLTIPDGYTLISWRKIPDSENTAEF
jgi:hypothetical protein